MTKPGAWVVRAAPSSWPSRFADDAALAATAGLGGGCVRESVSTGDTGSGDAGVRGVRGMRRWRWGVPGERGLGAPLPSLDGELGMPPGTPDHAGATRAPTAAGEGEDRCGDVCGGGDGGADGWGGDDDGGCGAAAGTGLRREPPLASESMRPLPDAACSRPEPPPDSLHAADGPRRWRVGGCCAPTRSTTSSSPTPCAPVPAAAAVLELPDAPRCRECELPRARGTPGPSFAGPRAVTLLLLSRRATRARVARDDTPSRAVWLMPRPRDDPDREDLEAREGSLPAGSPSPAPMRDADCDRMLPRDEDRARGPSPLLSRDVLREESDLRTRRWP